MSKNFVEVQPTWDYLMIPSERPLHAILADIVQHGVDYPTHGVDCSCMDRFSYEVKAHVNRVLPELEHRDTGQWATLETRDARMKAGWRIQHVLNMVTRTL